MTTMQNPGVSAPGRTSSLQQVKAYSAAIHESFRAFRTSLESAGPLDARTRELILLGGFTVARQEGGFKTHCRRALELGASLEEVRHAAVISFGAISSLEATADALRWVDDVVNSR